MTSSSVGIDLGTTNSVLAQYHKNQPKIITNQEGDLYTPSIVSFANNGDICIGKLAKKKINPKNEIYGIKRIIGRKFTEITNEIKSFPFNITKNIKNEPVINIPIDTKILHKSPQDISAFILKKLNDAAQDRLHSQYSKEAVITVPAYFNHSQRLATKQAAQLAGIQVLALLNEPTAAALQYMFDNIVTNNKTDNLDKILKKKTVLVYDFGGGTFDISLIEIVEQTKLKVLLIDGDTNLGGMNISEKLQQLIYEKIKLQYNFDLTNTKNVNNPKLEKLYQRIRSECKDTKEQLTFHDEVDFFLSPFTSQIDEVDIKIKRIEFEQKIDPIVKKTISIIRNCLTENKKHAKDIDEILLIGGTSRIPLVQRRLSQYFGEEKLRKTQNPDQAVALGAVIYAAKLTENPESLQKLQLDDVLSFSLGTDVEGNIMSFILRKNQRLPAQKTKTYKTVKDNQGDMLIRIYEGESESIWENRLLGSFVINDITKALQGEVKIMITFEVDIDGILHVSAKDQWQNINKELTISLS